MEYEEKIKIRPIRIDDYTLGPCLEDILRKKSRVLDDKISPLLVSESLRVYDEIIPVNSSP